MPWPSTAPERREGLAVLDDECVAVLGRRGQTAADAAQWRIAAPAFPKAQGLKRSGERRSARGVLRRLELLSSSVFAASGNPLSVPALSARHFGGSLGVVGR